MQLSTSATPSVTSTPVHVTNVTQCDTPESAPPPSAEAQPPSDHALAKCDTAETPLEAHAPLPATPNVSDQSHTAIPNSQITAPPDETNPFALSDRQKLALGMILAGLPDAAVAKQVGVARMTIYRWRHFNCAFLAELNRRRLDNWNASHDKLRALLPRALVALSAGLKSDDLNTRLRSARTILAHVAPDPEALKPPERQLSPTAVLHDHVYAERHRRKGDPSYHKPVSDNERDAALQYFHRRLQRAADDEQRRD